MVTRRRSQDLIKRITFHRWARRLTIKCARAFQVRRCAALARVSHCARHGTHKRFVGMPVEIAGFIETWFRAGAERRAAVPSRGHARAATR
jgi:hypothetical protein